MLGGVSAIAVASLLVACGQAPETGDNGNNDGKYSNPEFDAAIEASKVADKATHYEQLHKAEDILMEDMGCIPVAYYNDFWLQSPSLQGTWHSPYGYWYLQYGYVE